MDYRELPPKATTEPVMLLQPSPFEQFRCPWVHWTEGALMQNLQTMDKLYLDEKEIEGILCYCFLPCSCHFQVTWIH